MKNTLVGIFAQRREHAGRLFNNLAFDYIKRIEEVWWQAIIIPAFSVHLESYIEMCERFVFPGGPDIDPSLYGREISGARGIVPGYDRWLLGAMDEIMRRQKPILGICKGMQLMNIALWGTLTQDVEEHTHHFQMERWYEKIDTVTIMESSFLTKVYDTPTLAVNSIHHQAVENLGDWLRIIARSEHDGEIEAIEHTSLPYYGVQWHPEYLDDHREIFRWFMGI